MSATEHAGELEEGVAYLTIEEVCERYRLTRRALLGMVDAAGFPPALRLSARRWLFREDQVAEWEAGRWVGAGDLTARADAAKTAGSALRQPGAGAPQGRRG